MSGGTNSKSPTDRREWRQRPTAERVAYANKLLVLHPRFREAVALLERCHQRRVGQSGPAASNNPNQQRDQVGEPEIGCELAPAHRDSLAISCDAHRS